MQKHVSFFWHLQVMLPVSNGNYHPKQTGWFKGASSIKQPSEKSNVTPDIGNLFIESWNDFL
jgi:hypothetical protein